MAEFTGTSSAQGAAFNSRGLLLALTDRVRRMFRAWHNRRMLEALPDHVLKDIGVSRSEIPWLLIDLENGGSGRSPATKSR